MEQFMTELQPALINLLIVSLGSLGTWIGITVKNFLKDKINTDTKKRVVETTCKYIEQLYIDLDGAEKLKKAKENILAQLNEKGIEITELELDVLIESTVNGFNQALK